MGRPNLDMSNLVDSNVDLFMYLIEGIRVDEWKVRRLSSRPKFPQDTLTDK